MRTPTSYEAVFDVAAPLEVWPQIAHILKKVDIELEKLRPQAKATDRFLKGWRYLVAFLILAEHFGRFMYSKADIVSFNVDVINDDSVGSVWNDLTDIIGEKPRIRNWTSHNHVFEACMNLAARRSISDVKGLTIGGPKLLGPTRLRTQPTVVTAEFVSEVKKLLPPQPWKPGIHKALLDKLGCGSSSYSAAVENLIEEGSFFRQKDGVLYDNEGNVVGFDADRVDPETLGLVT